MRRCLDGEQAAWALLVERYSDVVYGVARRSGLTADDAGDVVQEVFVALLRSLRRLRRTERLLAWVLRTARREAWRHGRRRRASARREGAAARGEEDPHPLPASALAALEEEQAVRTAFGAIPERCRRLLDLLFFVTPPPPYAEIAERMGMPVGSLGPTRRRCLEALRVALEAEGFPARNVSRPRGSASRGVGGRRP